MTDKLKIGIIGLGGIAQIAHVPIWRKLDDVEIVAVCDSNKKKAEWIAEKFDVGHAYSNVDDLLKHDEIEAVDICTPTDSHRALTIAALSGGKHVLVEKPMARNYDEASKMAEAARKCDKKLMIGMNVRFREDAVVLKTFAQKGELGEIFYTKAGWLRKPERFIHKSWFEKKEIAGGGVFMDLGIQMLDVGLWLMGEPKAESVKATTYNVVSGLAVEDSAAAFIRLDNGATLTIEVSWSLLSEKDFFYTNLFGGNGGALLNPLRIHKELHGSLVNVTPVSVQTPENVYIKSYENEIRHFANSLKDEAIAASSPADNLERMRIVDAVYESSRSGREVVLG